MVLLLTGCSASQSSAPRTEPASGIGLVSGVLGLELSDGPTGPTTRTAASDLALVTRTQQDGSVTWRRLVVADGSSGWTSRALDTARTVRVRASARPFVLLNKSPDDADFGEAAEIPVDADSEGQIVGASRRGRVAGNQELMLPEKYRHALPWLELKFGSMQGYAPFDWIALQPTPAPQVRTLEEGLDALTAKGLVWKPFLGPLSTSPVTHVTPGTAFDLEDLISPPTKIVAPEKWSRLEYVFRDERGLMAVYEEGPRRLFRFITGTSPPAHIILRSESARLVRTRHKDLNADGALEWMVELAARYGDGFYAVLWVIDGRSWTDSLMLRRLSLSQSTGESSSTGTDASWELRDDGIIQVTRETAGKKRTTLYRYTDRLVEVD